MAASKIAPTGLQGADKSQDVFVSVQYLRGLAALMVLLYHVGFAFSFLTDELSRPHWLAAGVDIFFLISGFVMVVSTQRREIGGLRFIKERLARIVPLYWLVTAIFLAILAVQGRSLPSLEEVAKSLTFVFTMNPRVHEAMPVLVAGWTLNYEMIFYLLFALLIAVPLPGRIVAMASIFLVLCAFRRFVSPEDALLFRLTSPQPLEFVAGMALAYVRHRLCRLPVFVGGAVLVAGFVALALVDSPFTRVVHFAPCATLIMAGTVICERKVRSDWRMPKLLGDSSYSLYLTHGLLLELFATASLAPLWRLAGAIAMLAASIALSFAFFRWVEVPCLQFFRRRLKGHPALAPVDTIDVDKIGSGATKSVHLPPAPGR